MLPRVLEAAEIAITVVVATGMGGAHSLLFVLFASYSAASNDLRRFEVFLTGPYGRD